MVEIVISYWSWRIFFGFYLGEGEDKLYQRDQLRANRIVNSLTMPEMFEMIPSQAPIRLVGIRDESWALVKSDRSGFA